MISIIFTLVSLVFVIPFFGWLVYKLIGFEKLLKEFYNLQDKILHRDEEYYRTHSDFVIIEIDDENNDDTNQSIT